MSCVLVVVHHTCFTPNEKQWQYLLEEVGAREARRITEFVQTKDRERALLSVLLQVYTVRRCLPSLEEYSIKRTLENKPYITPSPIPGFNYNVSHHGDYVGIISHTSLLVGLDIVDIRTRCNWIHDVKDFIAMYTKQFTPVEVKNMLSFENENDSYTYFFVNWALKEAYVKAIGVGIGIDLQQVEFSINYVHYSVGDIFGGAELCVSNIPQYNWRFEFSSLDDSHIMATARGPINCAQTSYQQAAFPSAVEFHPEVLASPLPLPEELCITDILTDVQKVEWNRLR